MYACVNTHVCTHVCTGILAYAGMHGREVGVRISSSVASLWAFFFVFFFICLLILYASCMFGHVTAVGITCGSLTDCLSLKPFLLSHLVNPAALVFETWSLPAPIF